MNDPLLDNILNSSSEFISHEPTYILSGSGWSWFYDPDERTMVPVLRGIECFIDDLPKEEDSKITIYTSKRRIVVKKEDVIEVGWN
jgi:hypothetical protein